MTIKFAQTELTVGLRGGAETWDTPQASVILVSDFFEENNQPLVVFGSIATTETGADTATFDGLVLVQGAVSAAEVGADAATIVGIVPINGSFAASELTSDSASFVGRVLISGGMSSVELGQDAAVFAGKVVISGQLAATESVLDSASISCVVVLSGSVVASEGGLDTAQILGKIHIDGNLLAVESGFDVAVFDGEVTLPTTFGDLYAVELYPLDGAVFFGKVIVSVTIDAAETGMDQADISYIRKRLIPLSETGASISSARATRMFTGRRT